MIIFVRFLLFGAVGVVKMHGSFDVDVGRDSLHVLSDFVVGALGFDSLHEVVEDALSAGIPDGSVER